MAPRRKIVDGQIYQEDGQWFACLGHWSVMGATKEFVQKALIRRRQYLEERRLQEAIELGAF